MINKKGFEVSFGWIFSIIVGAMIIFLAIYGTSKLISQERNVQDSETAQQLGALLNPLESSLESGSKPSNLSFPTEARIYNKCLNIGKFGVQEISVATKSGIGKEWQNAGLPTKSSNKYVFSSSTIQGKDFFTFVKPIHMPFKIGDMIAIWSEEYCFVNTPDDISEEIDSLKLSSNNLKKAALISSCSKTSKIVCFDRKDKECKIIVDTNSKKVTKDKISVYYEGPLVYGAIISDPVIYECQIARITKRAEELSKLYQSKSELISSRNGGCGSILVPELMIYTTYAKNATSKNLEALWIKGKEIEKINKQTICPLWKEESE